MGPYLAPISRVKWRFGHQWFFSFMQWRYATSLNQTKSSKVCQDSHTTLSSINTQHIILCYSLPWSHIWGPYLGWNMTFWAPVVVNFMQWRYASSLNQTKSTKIFQDSLTTLYLINIYHNILCTSLHWSHIWDEILHFGHRWLCCSWNSIYSG